MFAEQESASPVQHFGCEDSSAGRIMFYTGATRLFLAIFIVGYKSFRLACVNPADTLRYE